MAVRMPLNQRLTRIAGYGLEVLREYFTDHEPLGGVIPSQYVIHRGGIDIPVDFAADCQGEAWVNVLRVARTTVDAFPGENPLASNCGSARAIGIQFGVARCATMPDDAGNPPSPDALGHEGLVSVDDGARLDNAMCRLARRLEEDDIIDAYAIQAGEPVGPLGGVLSWVQTASLLLA